MTDRITMETAEKQVEAFLGVLRRRYNIKEEEIPELLEAVRWALEHRDRLNKYQTGGMLAMLSTILGASLFALFEGVKQIMRRGG